MYYGSHKILEVKELKGGLVDLTFEPEKDSDGSIITVPNEVTSRSLLDTVQTEEPTDATALRQARISAITEDVMQVLVLHNLYLEEFGSFLDAITDYFQDTALQATTVAWGKESHERSLLDCKKLLQERFK